MSENKGKISSSDSQNISSAWELFVRKQPKVQFYGEEEVVERNKDRIAGVTKLLPIHCWYANCN